MDGGVISGQDATAMDQKMDDGDVRGGKLRTARGRGLVTADCYANVTFVYTTTDTGKTCRILFDLGL